MVGGGAAGLVAAWRSALAGRDTLLLEANPRLGVKVRTSGVGRFMSARCSWLGVDTGVPS